MKKYPVYYNQSLTCHISQYIVRNGPILFRDFFHEVLYSKSLGYYSSSRKKIGNLSDFTTAPNISPLFGSAIAVQCYEIIKNLKEGSILEFGAGTGSMAVEILLFLESKKSLPNFYYIVEISETMKQKQFETFKKKVPHILRIIRWVSSAPKNKFQGIILANELLDAMPVHKFRFYNGKLQEAFVNFTDDKFTLSWGRPSKLLKHYIHNSNIYSDNQYESEINLSKARWLSAITKALSKGLVLIIDYGFNNKDYYSPEKYLGNTVCYRRHKAYNDPLLYAGYQDITTHVNFTNLAKEGIKQGLTLGGYINQSNFLVNCGAIDLLHESEEKISTVMKFKQLTLPGIMGDIFKVIAFKKDLSINLTGFDMLI